MVPQQMTQRQSNYLMNNYANLVSNRTKNVQ